MEGHRHARSDWKGIKAMKAPSDVNGHPEMTSVLW